VDNYICTTPFYRSASLHYIDPPAVDLLWKEVKPIINAVSEKMNSLLLGHFGVSQDARSCLCRQFDTVLDLLEIYLSCLPRDGVMDEDDTPTASNSNNSSSEGVNMSSLRELLLEVDERETPVNVDEDDEEDTDGDSDDGVVDSDAILFAEDGETGSTTAARKFRALLSSSSMDDLVMSSKEGMKCLQMKQNETGSTTGDQKFQSLTGRWYTKSSTTSTTGDGGDAPGIKTIERNTRIQVTVKQGSGAASISAREDFRVLGIYTKYDNKWYIADEKGRKQVWNPEIASKKYRVLARMICFDQSAGLWQDMDPNLSNWETK
jgi:hypothetical protein